MLRNILTCGWMRAEGFYISPRDCPEVTSSLSDGLAHSNSRKTALSLALLSGLALEEVWGSSWAYSSWDRGWMWVRTSLAGVWNSPRVLVEASCMMLAMKRKPDRLMALPLASVVSMATMLVEAGSPWYTASFCCS